MKLTSITFIVISACIFIGGTASVSTTGPNGYDPWMDLDDDGDIDIFDIVKIAGAYGTSGTPLNKTALLLELDARVAALNATVMTLLSSTTNVHADLFADTTDASGHLRVDYPTGMFTTPPHLSVAAWFSASGIAQMAHVTILENTRDNCTIYLRDGMGISLSSYSVQVSYVAVGDTPAGSESQTCTGVETLACGDYAPPPAVVDHYVKLMFPVVFANASNVKLSFSGTVVSGLGAGHPSRITLVNVTTTYAVLALDGWDGSGWVHLNPFDEVQISYVAMAN